jgi:hypothetical protein
MCLVCSERHWARENADWTKRQSGASGVAGCRSSQKHGMKFVWIVSVHSDCFRKFKVCFPFSGIANPYSVAILWRCYWNDLWVRRVCSGILIFAVVCSANKDAVAEQVGSGSTCVQITAERQTVATDVFRVLQLATRHPTVRCCGVSHW